MENNQQPIGSKEGGIPPTFQRWMVYEKKMVPGSDRAKGAQEMYQYLSTQIAALQKERLEANTRYSDAMIDVRRLEEQNAALLTSNKEYGERYVEASAESVEYRKMLFEIGEFLESKDYLAFAEDISGLLRKHSKSSKSTQQ